MALYGRNGKGKSMVLAAVERVLTGRHRGLPAALHLRVLSEEDDEDAFLRRLHDAVAEGLAERRNRLIDDATGFLRGEPGDLVIDAPWEQVAASGVHGGRSLGQLVDLHLDAALEGAPEIDDQDQFGDIVLGDRLITLVPSGSAAASWEVYASALRTGESDSPVNILYEGVVGPLRTAWEHEQRGDGDAFGSALMEVIQFPQGFRCDPMLHWADAINGSSTSSKLVIGARPEWVPIELVWLGRISASPVRASVGGSTEDLDVATRELLLDAAGEEPILEAADGAEVIFSPLVAETVASLIASVNNTCASFLSEPPPLRFNLRHPHEWFARQEPFWEALDEPSGRWIPLDGLSTAQRRWARIAIQFAVLATTGFPRCCCSTSPNKRFIAPQRTVS